MNHLANDFGVTAWIATLVVIGSFVLLAKGVNPTLEIALVAEISAIVTAIVVIKAGKNRVY